MSTINFTCPHCSYSVQLPANAEGKKGNCPKCSATVAVTATQPAASSALPPASQQPTQSLQQPPQPYLASPTIQYYIQRGSTVTGPFSMSEVQKMARQKEFLVTDLFSETPEGPFNLVGTKLSEWSTDENVEEEKRATNSLADRFATLIEFFYQHQLLIAGASFLIQLTLFISTIVFGDFFFSANLRLPTGGVRLPSISCCVIYLLCVVPTMLILASDADDFIKAIHKYGLILTPLLVGVIYFTAIGNSSFAWATGILLVTVIVIIIRLALFPDIGH